MAGVKRPRLPQGQWTLIVDHGTDLACLWHIHSIGLSIDGMAGCTRKFLDVRGHAFSAMFFVALFHGILLFPACRLMWLWYKTPGMSLLNERKSA